ncbi:MAG: 50S ribosomal protein L35 [Candidatus Roseilinea sp.]|jgi:large subunit ribosomal protein L35|uniref:large ribosomal subunit protein bL35 n=1 Tax=Candidatus Roseilinea sp. NK_OTU-006 TaxID=2704250 RepID=UPI000F2398D8|nr:50S ribosomal protein L35 [Candidatus Roseilinea sp. NK_OTU-006]RMG62992.1 MAG: 50S ribosomal protein L35 [Chloroflexota bacterium]GIV85364.1 MAG: 50S ribosomal protein L35 [Candidatus Roseilinea sp.]
MGKIKTHKSTSKRFKVTGSGKLMRTRQGKSHFRRKKPARVKALFVEMTEVEGKGIQKRIRKLAPYLKNK